MKVLAKGLFVVLALGGGLAGTGAVQAQELHHGVDTCQNGFVWRDAAVGDRVCVTPAARQRAAEDNAMAASRIDPLGAYGPNTCLDGFVWREAFAGDMVCVVPATRTATVEENRLNQSRKVLAYGPNTCLAGFVWREAFAGDMVCVTPDIRTLVHDENINAHRTRIMG